MYILICCWERDILFLGKFDTFAEARNTMRCNFEEVTGHKCEVPEEYDDYDDYEVGEDYAYANEAGKYKVNVDWRIFEV